MSKTQSFHLLTRHNFADNYSPFFLITLNPSSPLQRTFLSCLWWKILTGNSTFQLLLNNLSWNWVLCVVSIRLPLPDAEYYTRSFPFVLGGGDQLTQHLLLPPAVISMVTTPLHLLPSFLFHPQFRDTRLSSYPHPYSVHLANVRANQYLYSVIPFISNLRNTV